MKMNEKIARAVIARTCAARPDGVWLVGVDSEHADVRHYSGQCALVLVDGERTAMLTPSLPWSTHPGQVRTTASGTPDVDGDGKRDVAWALPATIYPMKGRPNSAGRFNPATDTQPVYRDVSGAGTFAGVREANANVYPATAIQLHAGSSSKPVAIGCFTLPPKQFETLSSAIQRHASSGFRLCFEHVEDML